MVYYKLRQVLQSAMDLLQIATGITKCDDYYKLRQYRRAVHRMSLKTFQAAQRIILKSNRELDKKPRGISEEV